MATLPEEPRPSALPKVLQVDDEPASRDVYSIYSPAAGGAEEQHRQLVGSLYDAVVSPPASPRTLGLRMQYGGAEGFRLDADGLIDMYAATPAIVPGTRRLSYCFAALPKQLIASAFAFLSAAGPF
jgi:hypothetical protein